MFVAHYTCSYGFRPGRSAHDALDEIRCGLMDFSGGWVLDVDIQSFFDTIDHGQLRDLLTRRVRDGVLARGAWPAVVALSVAGLAVHVVLFVVAAPSADVVEAEIIAHVAAHRPPHMVPRSVRVVSSLPQTSTGKVNYPELKARAEETS